MARVVVVGGGVAGLSFANALTSIAPFQFDVVVLESGTRLVGETQRSINDPNYTHNDSAVLRTAERGAEWYPRGRGVGGGALINGRLAMAGQPSDWNAWATVHGATGWSWDTVAQHVRAVPTDIVDFSMMGDRAFELARAGRSRGWTVVPTRVFTDRIDSAMGYDLRQRSHVAELIVDGGAVCGVRTSTGEVVRGDHVVLAAGALASPRLAVSSGILGAQSIVGLKDHPAVCVDVWVTDEAHRGVGLVLERDDMQIVTMHARDRLTLVGAALRVHSRGMVERTGDIFRVDARMLDDARDVLVLSQCLEEMMNVLDAIGLDDGLHVTCGTEHTPLAEVRSMTNVDRVAWIRQNTWGNWHVASSMPMGYGAVTDPEGRVAGASNLWCCDAAIMCDLPRSPTQLPVMAVATEIAVRFAARCLTN